MVADASMADAPSEINFEAAFRKIFETLMTVGEDYATAKSTAWLLEEDRKRILAEQTQEADGSTQAERERLGRMSMEFREHCQITKDEIHKELSLKKDYDILWGKYEALRSLCSLEGKKIQLQ